MLEVWQPVALSKYCSIPPFSSPSQFHWGQSQSGLLIPSASINDKLQSHSKRNRVPSDLKKLYNKALKLDVMPYKTWKNTVAHTCNLSTQSEAETGKWQGLPQPELHGEILSQNNKINHEPLSQGCRPPRLATLGPCHPSI